MKTSMLGCETRSRAVEDLLDRPCEFQLRAMPPDVSQMLRTLSAPSHHFVGVTIFLRCRETGNLDFSFED